MTLVKELPLTKGYVAIVDDDDYEFVSQWKWSAKVCANTVYAFRSYRRDGKCRTSYLHREIMGNPDGEEVDHIDHNGLNNTRSNLRSATRQQNIFNTRVKTGVSGFRGVEWCKRKRKWRAVIRTSGRRKHIGYFSDPEDGARAYDEFATRLHGEYATLNFP